MKLLSDNGVVIAFQDIRTSNNEMFVYMLDQNGVFEWGQNGIQLSAMDVSIMNTSAFPVTIPAFDSLKRTVKCTITYTDMPASNILYDTLNANTITDNTVRSLPWIQRC
ncbi:MAG: hypothetical protein NTX61_10880 [Bacteroidetes bacterium]|nr:hypothetical protein [Bacteroidota bacterium]